MSGPHTIVLIVVIAALAILWIAATVGIFRSSRLGQVRRSVWLLAVLVLPLVGPVAWFVAGRPSSRRT